MKHGQLATEQPRTVFQRLHLIVSASAARHLTFEIVVGIFGALLAVAGRYALPLSSFQLPTLTVVVTTAVLTTFVGLAAGVTVAVVGGRLSWYLFFVPFSWRVTSEGVIPLFGFAVIATTIIWTASLYRRLARREHQRNMAALQEEARAAEMFASEMAHRVKNTLAVVQSVAIQTLGLDHQSGRAFSDRLKSTAAAQDLLNEHVREPTANTSELIRKVLVPFDQDGRRVAVECPDHLVVASREAITMALMLHELATNALKYGALSNDAGQVTLTARQSHDRLLFQWVERGGPTIDTVNPPGFGSKLLRQLGSGEMKMAPSGLRCTWSLRV